jgi:ribosomal protein S4E
MLMEGRTMAIDSEGKDVQDGDSCVVVAGTHKGKQGIVEDSNVSRTGASTVTVKEPDGNRFKTLAKNLQKSK